MRWPWTLQTHALDNARYVISDCRSTRTYWDSLCKTWFYIGGRNALLCIVMTFFHRRPLYVAHCVRLSICLSPVMLSLSLTMTTEGRILSFLTTVKITNISCIPVLVLSVSCHIIIIVIVVSIIIITIFKNNRPTALMLIMLIYFIRFVDIKISVCFTSFSWYIFSDNDSCFALIHSYLGMCICTHVGPTHTQSRVRFLNQNVDVRNEVLMLMYSIYLRANLVTKSYDGCAMRVFPGQFCTLLKTNVNFIELTARLIWIVDNKQKK